MKYQDEIESQTVIRAFIEFQFQELSFYMYLRTVVYLICCFLPAVIHVCYKLDTPDDILFRFFFLFWITNLVCTMYTSYILYKSKMATYLNILDFLAPLYLLYDTNSVGLRREINFLVIFYLLIQLIVHMRIFEKFYIITTLVFQSLCDIAPYGLLVSMWTLGFRNLFVQADITQQILGLGEYSDFTPETAMWTIFFSSQFLVLIILLNFLISIVSQSIEEVKDQATVRRYTFIANLNLEYLTLLYAFGLKTS